MKVLLINPTRTGEDSYVTPPLHLVYIAQSIQKAGHDAEIMDVHYLYAKDKHLSESKYDFENIHINEIVNKKFDVLGIGSIVSAFDFSKRLSLKLKEVKPSVPIIVGGGMSIALEDLWLKKTQVEFLVEADGEVVIQSFLDAYPDKERLLRIPGLVVRCGDVFKHNKPDLQKDLDNIDYPKWEILENIDDYMDILKKWTNRTLPRELQFTKDDRLLPIVMTRGCPYSCTFCYHTSNFFRSHSVSYIIGYIKHLKEKYSVNVILTWDDLIMANPRWFANLCDELKAQKLGVRIFTSGGKPNIITRDLLKKMKKAGIIRISYGIESGSQKMLDIMKKKTTVLQNYNAVKMTVEEGIYVHLNMVIGMPGESGNTLKETSRFLIDLVREGLIDSKNVSFSYATGYPGTELYKYMLDRDIVTDTEQYLRDQTGIGDYKFDLCGLGKKRLSMMFNKVLFRMNIIMAYSAGEYIQSIKYIVSMTIKLTALFILPMSLIRIIKRWR